MSHRDDIVRALGGEDVAASTCGALSAATVRAIERLAAMPGDDDPPPAACVAIALDEGASVEAVLAAMVPGFVPPDDADDEVIAAHAIAVAIDTSAEAAWS